MALDVLHLMKALQRTYHGVLHHLRIRSTPIASPFQRLDAEKLKAAKAEFTKLELPDDW